MPEFFTIALSTFISEDLACISAGILASENRISLTVAVIASWAGIFTGDMLLFFTGRFTGNTLITALARYGKQDGLVKRINQFLTKIRKNQKFLSGKESLQKNGFKLVLASRFLPGTRLPLYTAAGAAGMSAAKFTFYFAVATAIWTPVLVGLAYMTGKPMQERYEDYGNTGTALFILAVFLFFLITRNCINLLLSLRNYKQRRLLTAKILRIVKHEFWPAPVLYIPVILYILYLSVRYRSPMALTVCNPALRSTASGLVGESKLEILTALQQGSPGSVPRFTGIKNREDREEILKKIQETFPENTILVAKPDRGERGKGVFILNTRQETLAFVDSFIEDYHNCKDIKKQEITYILQEYIEGEEYGVFYYRIPGKGHGNLLAVTEKHRPILTGNGIDTVEKLILKDNRAVLLAEKHFQKWKNQLQSIPEKGEQIRLVSIGTHSLGCIFLDGKRLITKELTDEIDSITRQYKEFYIGRYDLIVSSESDLIAGENLKILELNGVSSEPTAMYDPSHSIFKTYGYLFRQWKLVYQTGKINESRGHKPLSLREFLRIAFQTEKL